MKISVWRVFSLASRRARVRLLSRSGFRTDNLLQLPSAPEYRIDFGAKTMLIDKTREQGFPFRVQVHRIPFFSFGPGRTGEGHWPWPRRFSRVAVLELWTSLGTMESPSARPALLKGVGSLASAAGSGIRKAQVLGALRSLLSEGQRRRSERRADARRWTSTNPMPRPISRWDPTKARNSSCVAVTA